MFFVRFCIFLRRVIPYSKATGSPSSFFTSHNFPHLYWQLLLKNPVAFDFLRTQRLWNLKKMELCT